MEKQSKKKSHQKKRTDAGHPYTATDSRKLKKMSVYRPRFYRTWVRSNTGYSRRKLAYVGKNFRNFKRLKRGAVGKDRKFDDPTFKSVSGWMKVHAPLGKRKLDDAFAVNRIEYDENNEHLEVAKNRKADLKLKVDQVAAMLNALTKSQQYALSLSRSLFI